MERWRKLQSDKQLPRFADLHRNRWDDFYCKGYGPDPEVAREKLDALKFEQEKAMFNPFDAHLPDDEPLFYTNATHPVSFACQCDACTTKTVPTSYDMTFLSGIKVLWENP